MSNTIFSNNITNEIKLFDSVVKHLEPKTINAESFFNLVPFGNLNPKNIVESDYDSVIADLDNNLIVCREAQQSTNVVLNDYLSQLNLITTGIKNKQKEMAKAVREKEMLLMTVKKNQLLDRVSGFLSSSISKIIYTLK
jgi:hypothetical protein